METQKLLNVLVKGAGIAAVGQVISKFLTYLYRVLVAQYIGPDAYGQLSMGLAVMGIFGSLSLLSVSQAINKYVAEHRSDDDYGAIKGVVVSAAQLTFIPSLAVIVVMYLSAGFVAKNIFNSPELVPVLKILAFVAPFSNFSSVCISTINAFKKLRYVVLTNHVFQNVVQLVVTAGLFILVGRQVVWAAWGWLAGVVLSSLLAFYFLETRIGPILTRDVDFEYRRRQILRYSSPLMLSAIMVTVLGWTDTLFLGYFMDDAQVGFYNAALPTAALIALPYAALNSLALPSLSEIQKNDRGSIHGFLENLNRWSLIVGFPAFILMALFSDQVLHLLFGKTYRVAGAALAILAFGQVYSTSTGHLGDFIKSVSRTNIILKNTVANLGFNVLFNLALVPRFGIEGAAVATAASMILVNSLLVAESYYFEGVIPFSLRMWKPLAASLLALAPTYALLKLLFETVPIWALFPGAAFYGVAYLSTLLFLGGVEEEDRDIIVGVGRRLGQEKRAEKVADLVIR